MPSKLKPNYGEWIFVLTILCSGVLLLLSFSLLVIHPLLKWVIFNALHLNFPGELRLFLALASYFPSVLIAYWFLNKMQLGQRYKKRLLAVLSEIDEMGKKDDKPSEE